MKKKRRKVWGSLLSFMIKNYILFTLLYAIFILLVMSGLGYLNAHQLGVVHVDKIVSQEHFLKQEQYREFPIKSVVGDFISFDIYNSDGERIYSHGTQAYQALSQQQLEKIATLEKKTIKFYEIENIEFSQGAPIIMMTEVTIPADLNVENTLEQVALNYHISMEDLSEADSMRTVQLLQKNQEGNMDKVNTNQLVYGKYSFTTNTNEQRTMVVYHNMSPSALVRIGRHIEFWAFVISLIFYFVFALIFSFWIRRKVNVPLKALDEAVTDLGHYRTGQSIEYSGPIEFVSIVEKFNTVSGELHASEEKQQQMESDRRKMLADISHDLKTPITIIQGYAKAINDGLVHGDKKQKYLEIIYQKSLVVNELINSFYEYSKFDHPEFTLTMERVDICEFMREFIAERYAEFELSHQFVNADIPDKTIIATIDRMAFERVLSNLVSNFFKYCPPESTLTLSVQSELERVFITVADNGVGVDASLAQTVFEPFVMANEARTGANGSGLGLAISRKIIQKMGGSIHLEMPPHTPYKTEFVIELPAQKE